MRGRGGGVTAGPGMDVTISPSDVCYPVEETIGTNTKGYGASDSLVFYLLGTVEDDMVRVLPCRLYLPPPLLSPKRANHLISMAE